MLNIIKAGIQTTVQDGGRFYVRHLGINQNGALDTNALTMANLLLGNEANAASLEIICGPVEIQFTHTAWFAVTGQYFELTINDGHGNKLRIDPGWRYKIQAQQRLLIHSTSHSGTAYLAIAGGIEVPPVLGSRSTNLAAGFGGHQGRALQSGDQIPCGEPGAGQQQQLQQTTAGVYQSASGHHIRAIPGPDYALFDTTQCELFWNSDWQAGSDSNRMGCRLHGPSLNTEQSQHHSLLSHAVIPGTVQVPPNGQPIVLLADAQTTGGYPRIATVISADLWQFAQLPAGAPFRFTRCDRGTAIDALKAQRASTNRFKIAIGSSRR